MALPTSQLQPFIYSGAVTATSTSQMITAITGMMFSIGWTTTGAGVLRSATDNQGRFFEMDVTQNTGVTLSNQIQFATYKTTRANDNNVLINKGFQISTGSTYKIYVTPFSVYSELNAGGQNGGNEAFAMQLYADPLTSGQCAFALLAGGHRNYGGSTATNTALPTHGSTYNGISGAAAAGADWKNVFDSQTSFAEFKNGRIMVLEDWVSANGGGADPVYGRVYNFLLAGGNAIGGFEIPSGTGTISYTILNAFANNGRWNYYIRIT